jgi:hypothetical protein
MGIKGVSIRVAVAAALSVLAAAAAAPGAAASCAVQPTDSPHAFVGTVVDAEEEDRIATVVTDDGRTVTVMGTQDIGWLTDAVSSVDRRFAVGARYEFHPVNARSPYRDNACTATTRLAGPRLQPLQPLQPSQEYLPGWLPVDEQAGPVGYLAFLGPLVFAAAVLIAVSRRALRADPDDAA